MTIIYTAPEPHACYPYRAGRPPHRSVFRCECGKKWWRDGYWGCWTRLRPWHIRIWWKTLNK